MYFYKYFKADNLNFSMLRHGEVFFASPKELNDIHECKPQFTFNANREVWSRFIEEILFRICIQLNLKPESQLAYEILSFKKDVLADLLNKKKALSLKYEETISKITDTFGKKAFAELSYNDATNAMHALNLYMQNELDTKLNDTLYITSFSKSATILTMWGLYSNAEKGFAIIYESTDGTINLESNIEIFPSFTNLSDSSSLFGTSKLGKAQLLEVDYKNKPVRANGFRKLVPTFAFSDQEDFYDCGETLLSDLPKYNENHIGRVKYTDWKYEKELRLHLPVFDELPSALRSIKISKHHIKGIIFGSKTNEDDKEKILAACYNLKKAQPPESDIYIFQAKSIPGQYKIIVTPLGRVCDIHGKWLPFINEVEWNDQIRSEELKRILEAINAS